MKLFKKVSAMMVSLLMALAVMVPVSADSRTITVNNVDDNVALSYVQVIKADRTKKTGWAFTNTTFEGYFKTAYEASDDQAAIQAYIKGGSSSTLEKVIAKVTKNATFTSFEHGRTTKQLDAGLYVIKVGDTTNAYNYKPLSAAFGFEGITDTKTVSAKKQPNTVIKSVIEDKDNLDDKDKAVQNGDKVKYTVKVKVPYINAEDENKTFKVRDELTGAKYVKDSVKIDGVDAGEKATIDTTNNQLNVNLDSYIDEDNSKAFTEVTITYDAIITAQNDEVTNTASASHGGNSEYSSDPVKLYTGNITLTKYAEDGETTLAGAGFKVFKGKDTKNALKFDATDTKGVYVYNPNGSVEEVVTDDNGQLVVKGLGLGEYQFKEVTAPTSYTINEKNATASLTKDGDTVSAVFTSTTSMKDTKVGSLPETGGIGTTIFTVGGCAIMVVAAALFFMNKKKHEK